MCNWTSIDPASVLQQHITAKKVVRLKIVFSLTSCATSLIPLPQNFRHLSFVTSSNFSRICRDLVRSCGFIMVKLNLISIRIIPYETTSQLSWWRGCQHFYHLFFHFQKKGKCTAYQQQTHIHPHVMETWKDIYTYVSICTIRTAVFAISKPNWRKKKKNNKIVVGYFMNDEISHHNFRTISNAPFALWKSITDVH